ncbi:50S ribosomal protein L23 [Candidatus Pyrohabitans sp.]
MDPHEVIIYPDVKEKSMKMIEKENKLVFVVRREANKEQVKDAVEKLYEVKVEEVNTSITPRGIKRAYVKLAPEYRAEEVATRIGIF